KCDLFLNAAIALENSRPVPPAEHRGLLGLDAALSTTRGVQHIEGAASRFSGFQAHAGYQSCEPGNPTNESVRGSAGTRPLKMKRDFAAALGKAQLRHHCTSSAPHP